MLAIPSLMRKTFLRNRSFGLLSLAGLMTLFGGCAGPALRYAPGHALLACDPSGADSSRACTPGNNLDTLTLRAPAFQSSPPDSIDAELSFLAQEGRRKTLVSGRLFARPGRCGKLDLYGLPGMLGGAFRWRNAEWELAIYDPPRYESGEGKRVPLPLPGGVEAPYDALFSPLWGSLLPWMPGTPLKRDSLDALVLSGPGEGGTWKAKFNAVTGLPDTLWDASAGWTLSYSDWKKKGDRLYPGKVTCTQKSATSEAWLEVEVRSLRDNPPWTRDPFVLRKPEGT